MVYFNIHCDMGQPFSENISSYDGYNGLYHINDKEYNVRTVTDGRGYACELNAYYPYGALMNTLTGNGTKQPYKYGGKELDRTAGLDLYDSQARFYDPVLGRTTTVDPKSGAYAGTSHYAWCAGNPVRFVDPDGRDAQIIIEGNCITIKSNVILEGPLATDDLAETFQKNIYETWGSIKSISYKKGNYSLKWDVTVRKAYKGEKQIFDGINNYMVVTEENKSSVRSTNHGSIRNHGREGYSIEEDCPMAHEFGHILGLRDRYKAKTPDPKDPRHSAPESEEWRGNIMCGLAYRDKDIDSKNLTPLLKPALNAYIAKKNYVQADKSMGWIIERIYVPNK